MWFQVELPEAVTVTEVQFDAAGGGRLGGGNGVRSQQPPPGGAPAASQVGAPGFAREYQIQLSLDGKDWGKPVAAGPGQPLTVAALRPTRARYLRITQTGSVAGAPAWVIQNLRIYEAAGEAPRTR